jgi:hypothetical protein
MKWLIICSIVCVGCGPAEVPAAPGGSGMGANIGSLPTGGSGGIGGMGGVGGGGGIESRGACDNASDLDAILNANDTMRNIARDCRVLGVLGCIQGRAPGLSDECTACYRNAETCSVASNCTSNCAFDTCSTDCLTCSADCLADLEECTGLPGDGCPG